MTAHLILTFAGLSSTSGRMLMIPSRSEDDWRSATCHIMSHYATSCHVRKHGKEAVAPHQPRLK